MAVDPPRRSLPLSGARGDEAQGHVQPGNAALRVRLTGRPWFLEVTRDDGDPELQFGPLHQRAVRAAELLPFFPGRPLRWTPTRALPGLTEGCHALAGPYRLDVTVEVGADTTWERALAELQAWLEPAGGTRLL